VWSSGNRRKKGDDENEKIKMSRTEEKRKKTSVLASDIGMERSSANREGEGLI
jgi:hypothetical protein